MPDSAAHSHIGASNSARWIACPGSVRLCATVEKPRATEYAATGTVAHSLCEYALTKKLEPADFLGTKINQDGFDVLVDQTMVDAVGEYTAEVLSVLKAEGGTLMVEKAFDLGWVHPRMFGRNDACIVPDEPFGTLYVFDYKNGRTPVGVEENSQLMYYAIGALGLHNEALVERVVVFIVQPNVRDGSAHVKRWEITVDALYDWVEKVLRPAAIATDDPEAPLCPGDHCTFCDAVSVCPARANEALSLLDAATPEKVATLPPIESIPPERLGKLAAFFQSASFKAWQKALAEAEYDLLSKGVPVPGRKLVQKTVRGNRKWADEAEVIKAFSSYGESIFDSKLKSPSQMEKTLADYLDKKEAKAKVAGLTTRDETVEFVVVSENEEGEDAAVTTEEALKLL